MANNKHPDPDQITTLVQGDYGPGDPMTPVNEHVAALRLQLDGELKRLESMVRSAGNVRDSKGNYRSGYAWIATHKDGERSEFSIRLARARALFEAIIAMETLNGVDQSSNPHHGPWSEPINGVHEDER